MTPGQPMAARGAITMRRANAQLQSDRRAEILDAAERCFARAGFHQSSMQEICAEAGMSPGNLYRYFPSKEALIAGISERNRAQAAADFAEVDKAPGFFTGVAALRIASGHLMPRDSANSEAAIRPAEAKAQPAFRVAVTQAKIVEHAPKLTLSGRTEADHKVSIAARTGGVLT